jgi:hypothetical protein
MTIINVSEAVYLTRAGCEVRFERAGGAIAMVIKQADGRTFTFACGRDEARFIASMGVYFAEGQ